VTLPLTGSKVPSNAGHGAASRAAAPLEQVRLWDGSTHWLVTGHAERCALLAGPRDGAGAAPPRPDREGGGQGGAGAAFRSLEDSGHGRLRDVEIPPFAVSLVKTMGPAVQRLVDDQVEALLAGPQPADLVSAFAEPVSSLVICQLLGVPPQDRAFLQRSSQILIDRAAPPDRARAALAVLENYLGSLAASKIATPTGDLLSRLADAVAGPLRHLSLVHSGTRLLARADIELGGVLIHEGASLILPAEPAAERAGGDQVAPAGPGCPGGDIRWAAAFGFGVHQRFGQALARVELLASYRALARRVPSLALAGPDIAFKRDGLVYGLDVLPVTW
jgi:cytochrome P450